MPEGWKLTRCEDGAIIVSKNNIGGYAAWKDDSNIASSILYHFADELLAAAPQVAEQTKQQEPSAYLHPTSDNCVSTDPNAYEDAIPLFKRGEA